MKRASQKAEPNIVLAAQLAQAFHHVGKINHYMVGVVGAFGDEELDRAEQILIGLQNKGPQKGKAFQALERALNLIEDTREQRRRARPEAGKACVECLRPVENIIGPEPKLDEESVCGACRESAAELKADEDEKLEEARRIEARRQSAK